ncbi:ATP-binding protein [Micromonospora wenchangensis]|uniref:ATP-binding protein n=1 Tax=Micromonospora wenchangensis TaxID=1185415 RepID=UPI003D733A26
MVDRDQQRDLLDSMFMDCASGKGGVLVVSGPVGTGKSVVLQEFANRIFQSDAVVLSASASRVERALPFEILAQIFQPLAGAPQHRAEVVRMISSDVCTTVLSDAATEEVERAYGEVFHDLWLMLVREAAEHPVVITVDDVHHADDSSLRGLLFLARRLKFVRCLMVLSEQTGPPHRQHPLMHAELFSQSHCRRVRLGPLTLDGVGRLVAARDIVPDGPALVELAAQCHAATGGNPLLVSGLLDDLAAASSSDTLPAVQSLVTGSFGEAVISCLHRSHPEIQQIVTGAAIFEAPTPQRVAALLDLDENTVRRCEPALTVTGLLPDWRPRHPAIRQAVLTQLSPRENGRLHVRAAALLRDERAPIEQAAFHLLAAGVPLPTWAVSVLQSAATEALANGRRLDAVRCLELARETTSDDVERAALTARLTLVEWRGNQPAAERHFPELMAAAGAGRLSWHDTAALVRLLLWHGRLAEAGELLDRPVAPAEAAGTALLRGWLASSYPRLATRLPAASDDDGNGFALPHGPANIAAEICAAVQLGELDEQCLHRAEQLLESCELDEDTREPMLTALCALIYADRLDVASRHCDEVLRQQAARRAPTWRAAFAACRGEIALRRGDLVLAKRHAHLALAGVATDRWGVAGGWPLSVLLLAATESGDLDEAAAAVVQPLPEAVLNSRLGMHYLYARGRYFLARGRDQLALDDFRLCGELLAEWKLDLPGLVQWRLGIAEVHLRAGELDQARQLTQAQLDHASGRYPRTAGLALRLHAATASDLPEQIRLLDEAEEALTAAGDLLHRAQVVMDLSRAYARSGAGDVARVQESRARELARRCAPGDAGLALLAAPPWPESVPAPEPAPVPHDSVVLDDLSESERRVAALAVQGHTNRQIARRLYITVSTVEQHLTSTYRKLKVHRRADLPDILTLVGTDG